ncbi:MAG: ribonuclease HII [Treponema sp.]|jgi:ribonuclease HII|nr:ribonuclease HII [Treponema sp.]
MSLTAGLDEAGRGPLAGPVYAAAVILPPDFPMEVLADSKKLNGTQRNKAAALILEKAVWGIDCAEASEIDRVNILRASLLAMTRAWNALTEAFPRHEAAGGAVPAVTGGLFAAQGTAPGGPPAVSAVVDGLYCPELPIPCRALVKADAQIPEVMAASILAKTARDRMMIRYSWFYPEYGYEKHKGYPTVAHRETVILRGPSPIQRHTFTVRPVSPPSTLK